MNATQIEQMEVPEGLIAMQRGKLEDANKGTFVVLPTQGRKLHFVGMHGNCQLFFPVLSDGTILNQAIPATMNDYLRGENVEVFLASEIPGLQITTDDKIVWAK
jgi:hypothetical protein